MVSGGDIRVGNIIKYNNKLYNVTNTMHVKPGKGGAFNQVTCQGVFHDHKIELRLRVEEKVERVNIFEKNVVCINKNEDSAQFIDTENADDFNIMKDDINFFDFLIEGMEVFLLTNDDNDKLGIRLPKQVEMVVKETPEGVKGGEKNAILINGSVIKVPQYIETGETIVVSLMEDKPSFKSRI